MRRSGRDGMIRPRALHGAGLGAAVALALSTVPASGEIRIRLGHEKPQSGTATTLEVEILGRGDFALGDALPRAWLVPEPQGQCAAPAAGNYRTELGGWQLILRNSDNTISAVDPKRELASGNIAWIRPIDGVIRDWSVDSASGIARVWSVAGSDLARMSIGTLNLADGSFDAHDAGSTTARPAFDPRAARSELARQSYRLADDGLQVRAIDDSTGADGAPFTLRSPAATIAVSPDGRWLMALTPDKGLVQVVDLATGRLRHALAIHAGFTRSVFTDNYLYLREADRPYVTMIRLSSLSGDESHVVAIPVGLMPSSDAMVPIGTDGVAFLSSEESAVYLYMESGMADNHGTMRSPTEMLAPYDVVKIRGSRPVDLAIHDRSLRQVAPGRFRTRITPTYGGPWRIVVRDRQSEQIACLDFTVEGQVAKVEPTASLHFASLGDNTPRFRVTGAGATALPRRIALLATVPGSNWQSRVNAIADEAGTYRIEDVLPRAARIMLVAPELPGGNEPLFLGPLP